jgi:hypothetical protein
LAYRRQVINDRNSNILEDIKKERNSQSDAVQVAVNNDLEQDFKKSYKSGCYG